MNPIGRRGLQHLLCGALALGTTLGITGLGVADTVAGGGLPPDAPRDAEGAISVKAAASEIDRLVAADLERQGLKPNKKLDHETFVRRVYLDTIGRIPTAAEARSYLESRDMLKRERLIDSLLDSPGYSSSLFHYFADMLRVKNRLFNRVSGEPYIDFIKQSLADNLPYDQFVHALLTAEGSAHARGNGATGYFLRDRGMPVDNMAITLRLFLGSRLECAQCHDHPFSDWKQREYFEMVAFTGGIQYRSDFAGTGYGRKLGQVRDMAREELGRNGERAFRRLADITTVGISGEGTGMVQLPHDYQYDDADPKQWISARSLFGDQVELPNQFVGASERAKSSNNRRRSGRRERFRFRPKEIDSRETFADWLTSAENPLFTRVIANRMWKRVMGLGLIEPVDDVELETQAVNPELMGFLEQLMVEVDYDLKQFQRILFNTKTYQRQATAVAPDPDQSYHFQGPVLRRMSAEQIWDSLLTLVVPRLDETLQGPTSDRAELIYSQFDEFVALNEDEMLQRVEREIKRYTDPDDFRAMQRERAAMARQERIAKQRSAQGLIQELARARKRKDSKNEARILAELEEMDVDERQFSRESRALRGLVRASDLPQPAPADHLLRQFGQSDREQVEGSHRDANVPQILSLMNGFVEAKLLANQYALLTRVLDQIEKPEVQVHTAFMSVLSRKPTREELRLWRKDLEQDSKNASRDLVWTLLNTHEFLFIR